MFMHITYSIWLLSVVCHTCHCLRWSLVDRKLNIVPQHIDLIREAGVLQSYFLLLEYE